jgi:RNA polymerase sigma-70 factor (ECF subfamily)
MGAMALRQRRGAKAVNDPEDPSRPMLDEAFAELRPAMFALAYRITGNRADAEEIVQDAFVRLHTAEPKDAVRSLKSYLATITARLSLNRLRDQRARRETYVGEWLPEPLQTADQPGARAEEISFALLVMLERLSPLERVVFVLHNAFDLTFEEIAPVARRNAAACRKIFSRARARILEERPRFTVDRARHRALLRSFDEAARSGDTAKLIALLDDNVVFHGDDGGRGFAPEQPVVGRIAVANFIIAVTRRQPASIRVEETELNGAPALVLRVSGRNVVAILIDADGDCIHSIFAIGNPAKLAGIAPLAGADGIR